jgi:hypothetical protein
LNPLAPNKVGEFTRARGSVIGTLDGRALLTIAEWRRLRSRKSATVAVDISSGERVATNCSEDGVLSPPAPVEASELTGMAPGVGTLSPLESVWTDTLSGEPERVRFDQCVVSNGGVDGASKMFESAEAGTSTGELEMTVHGRCVITGRFDNSSEAAILRTTVEAGDLTGKGKEPETITTDVGLAWTNLDGRTMKMADWSRARLHLLIFWRTGVGWLDEIISLLAERWKYELSRMPPLQRRGCKQRPRTFGRKTRTGVDGEHGVAGAVSFKFQR